MYAVILSLWLSGAGPACPAQTVEVSRDEATHTLVCRRIAELTLNEIAGVSSESRAALSDADRLALDQKQAILQKIKDDMNTLPGRARNAAAELPFMPDADLRELDAYLAAEQRDPVVFSLLLALGAALGAVGSAMTGFAPRTLAPLRFRMGLAAGAIVGLVAVSGGYVLVRGGLPLIGFLSGKAQIEPVPAIGFAPGTAESALQNVSRLQHAVDHLTDSGVMPNWSNATKGQAIQMFQNILESPLRTFDHTLPGPVVSRGFSGIVNGKDVVVFVFKEGNKVGQIATAVVPSANQVKYWGIR